MKRVWIALLTALGTVALLATAALAPAATTTKVKTKVTLKYAESTTGTPPYEEQTATFFGKVKAKKGCKKGRQVKVPGAGTTRSANDGKYEISLSDPAAPGTYRAKVKKKKIQKNGKKIVCKKGKSKPVTVS